MRDDRISSLICKKLQEEKVATPKIDMRSRLEKLKKSSEKKSMLMQMEAKVEQVDEEQETCAYCHEKITGASVAPAFVTRCLFNNMEIPYVCFHKYHEKCSKGLEECSVCGFSFKNRISCKSPGSGKDWINEEVRLLIFMFECIPMEKLTAERIVREIQKAIFLMKNTNNTEQFSENYNDLSALKKQIYENIQKTPE